MDADTSARSRSVLKWILAASIVSTGLHYTHNFIAIDSYPDGPVSGAVTQVAILLSWPLLTAIGLLGYRFYVAGRLPQAHACLIAYSFTGISTLGHFIYGSPDIPAFFYGTIFTDALTGFAVLAFALRSISQSRGRTRRASSAAAA
jgi:RsiW-degrading membrane proteinase PrsW (M82 family)